MVIDLAHNEAGLEALLEIMNGIRPPGRRLLLGVGSAGDRGDDVFVRLGEMAALGADVVEIAHKTGLPAGPDHRGARSADPDRCRPRRRDRCAGAPDELAALTALVGQARDGDVVAMMTHPDREEVDAWLIDHGATRDEPGCQPRCSRLLQVHPDAVQRLRA